MPDDRVYKGAGGQSRRDYDGAGQTWSDVLQNVDLGADRVFEKEVAAKPDKSNDPAIRCPVGTGKALEQHGYS